MRKHLNIVHWDDNCGPFCGGCAADIDVRHVLKGVFESMNSCTAEIPAVFSPDDLKLS